ncbi:PEP-CTERM sorting domain-containing protein [Nitrosovibrio sp. Nv17]|uniref:PEP-CTERM sorting domain-containing protein n=1 Tax=Nitrosovibrio sp. Nv17 TaxID=1855339 RepID=UPI0009090019|nr:PEP-CTERM sorting domain-containing protein [Nitrosovibrio sp. Nv17]SFW13775.1 PEP-CTERM protein-sorting domain-containing protein [Nitrosovibrio sp. Nv17]
MIDLKGKKWLRSAACGIALLPGLAHAGLSYDEARDATGGDFANAVTVGPWLSPGTFAGILGAGGNTLSGTFGGIRGSGSPADTDVFSFQVPAGYLLTAIHLDYSVVEGDSIGGSYFGIQEGLAIGTGINTVSSNLSNALIGADAELLAVFSGPPYAGGDTELTAPLGAGDYTLFLSETDAVVAYRLDFTLAPVPEPESYAMLLAGLGLLGGIVRGRRRAGPA